MDIQPHMRLPNGVKLVATRDLASSDGHIAIAAYDSFSESALLILEHFAFFSRKNRGQRLRLSTRQIETGIIAILEGASRRYIY